MPAVYASTVEGYDRGAERYRDWWAPVIAPAAVHVLERLAPAVPETPFTLLDVGTGAGTLALAALERWDRVRVVGVDPSTGLLEVAGAEARRRRKPLADRLELRRGSGAELPLPDESVDVAASSFVIQLVPSRAAMLREVLRVLRPGGTFACVTWQAGGEPSAADEVFDDVLDEFAIEPPPPWRDPRPFPSPSAAAAELRRAGFGEVSAATEWLEHRYTPEGYLEMLEHWAEDELFEELDPPTRERLRARLLTRLRELSPEELRWRRPLVEVSGRRSR